MAHSQVAAFMREERLLTEYSRKGAVLRLVGHGTNRSARISQDLGLAWALWHELKE
jgi:hypothetical protein